MSHLWLREFARRVFGISQRRKGTITHRKPADRHLLLEALEIRLVPSTFTVTNTNDTGSGSLRAAIALANANSGAADTILFDSAVFGIPQTIKLTSGPLTLTDTSTTTITGPGASLLTISGNNASQVFVINSGDSASLSALTITNGKVTGQGGGVSNSGTLTMTDCTISGSTATHAGGGLDNNTGATATLTNCTVSSNTLTAANSGGAGIHTSGSLTLTNCVVSGNSGSPGGLCSGGGINAQGSGPLILVNTTISGNSATDFGGGLVANGTVTLTGCTISGNTATHGGGGIDDYSANITLTDCTVSGNQVTGPGALGGGGVFISLATLNLVDVTISANTASSGGGIYKSSGTLNIGNTIVSANTASTGPDVIGTINTDNGHNLFGAALSGTTSGTGDLFNDTPQLAALGNYGGPTQTMLPLEGSPAIGAGSNTGGPANDQRGFTRASGTGGDIGAAEGTLYTVTTSADSGAGSLRTDMTAAGTAPGGSVIQFAAGLSGATITLGGTALPQITGNLQIDGLGVSQLTISGNNASSVFSIASTAVAALSGLTITAATGGAVNDSGTVSLTNSAITASAGGGFNLVDFSAGTATLTNVTVSGNSGIGVHNGGNGGQVRLVNCTVTGNTGIGIDTQRYPNTTLINTTVSGNGGVGINAFGNTLVGRGYLTVTNSTVKNNAGGGLTGIIAATVTNSTITGNSAANGAGVSWGGHTISLINSTVSGNNASSQGGGLRLSGSGAATVANTIIAGNTGPTGPDVSSPALSVTSQGFNLIGKTDGSNTTWLGTDLIGTIASPLNPLLAPLGYYGGPTQTMPPEPGSLALLNGNPSAVGLPATDQRGFARVVNAKVDIGAFQTQAGPFTVVTTDDIVTGVEPAGVLSLRNAITLADALAPASGTSISFDIPTTDAGYSSGTGVYTITVSAALPTISARMFLDGTTQPGYTTTPVIQLGGASAGAGVNGLTITAANSSVKGLAIVSFDGDGIVVNSAVATGDTIRGNTIYNNTGLAIHLTNGGNNNAAAPVLLAFGAASSTVVSGTFGNLAGVTITLDAYANTVADPRGGPGQFYLGGQQVTTGAGGAFTITVPGATLATQFVSATATDAAGNTSQFAADVTSNSNPIVAISAPAGAVAGAPVSLTSVLTDTTQNKTYTYAWTVTQNGNPAFSLPASAITDEPTLVFVPPTPGTFVAHLTVTDNLGGSATATPFSLVVRVPGPGVVISGTPGNPITANTAVNLTSAVSEPTGATTTSYTWEVTLNNGQSFTLPTGTPIHNSTFAFTPTANGLYQISLTVSDCAGGSTTTSVFVTVAASGQTATIYNVPRTGFEGSRIVVNGAGNPSLTAPYTYNWAVFKNGAVTKFFEAPADTTGSFAFTPDAPGLYQVTLVITDSLGHTAPAFRATIPVAAVPPTPQVLSFPSSASIGQFLTLAGTATSAGTADPVIGLTWIVTSSNGQVTATGAGATFHYTPSVAGTDTVTLTAVTASGSRGSENVQIVVAPAPTISVTAPSPLLEGTPGRLTATVNNPHAGTYVFVWTVVEQSNGASISGTISGTSPTSNFDFRPPLPGAYLVTVNAINTSDNTTATVGPLTFQAANVAPTISAISVSPTTPSEGTPVTLSATVNDPGLPLDVLHYKWTVTGPDGFALTATDTAPKFTPNESGSYTATLTVTDSSGAPSAPFTTTFSVAHVTPTLTIQTVGGTVVSGSTVTVSLKAVLGNDPGNDEAGQATTVYTWAVTPAPVSSSSNGANFTFTGNTANSYQVTVTFTDDDGDHLTAVAPLLVFNAGTTKTLTAGDVPAGATQIVAVTQGSSRLDASAITVPVVVSAVGTGHDTLVGGAGPSVLVGDSGFNSLVAGSGPATLIATQNDTLVGGSGSNLFSLNFGAGEVVQSGTSISNTLSFAPTTTGVLVQLGATPTAQFGTGTGAPTVSLSGFFQSLVGGSGNDTLMSGGGSNIFIQAGSGNTQLIASGGTSVTLFGGTGNDTLSSSGGTSVSMVGGSGNDTLVNSGGTSITMFGGTGNDSLSSTGGTGVTLVSGGGNSTLSSSGGSSITMFGGTGNDSLSSTGGTSVSMVSGGGNTTLSSSGGSSVTMFGGTGNDSLQSSGGTSVSMVGGSGNETLVSSGGSSVTMFGGTGNDSLSSTGGTNVTMVSGGGNTTLSSSGGTSVTMFGGTGNDSLSSTGGTNVTLVGGSGNTTLSSSGGTSVTMFGGTGNDSLASTGVTSVSMVSGGGNTTLSSSGGSSVTMFGGTGNDSLSSSGGTGVTMVGGSGNESLSSSGGSSITMFGGTGNDSLSSTGGTSVSMVSGGGNTTLSSSGGSSVTMFGGIGNDTLQSSGGTGITMVGGSGNESLSSSGDSNVLLLGSSSVTQFGGAGNDTLSSTGGTSVTIVGGSGNDSLSSSGGTSVTMFGGTGNDTLTSTGGTSVSLVGGSGNSTLSSSGGTSVTMFGGTGNDSLASSGGTGVTMVGGTGNSTLSSTDSSDVLLQTNSGSGTTATATVTNGTSVTMFGGAGNDTLSSSGGSSITMVAGSGNDTLSSSGGTGVLIQGGVVIVTQTGGSSITMFGGTGNDSLTSSGGTSVTIIGGSGNGTLTSTGGSSVTMFGGTGNDSLQSSGGTSVSLIGGSGNTTLSSSGGTSITMFGGTGNDSLQSSGGTSVTMVGGSGNSTLVSSGGSSVTMFGGTGNDSLSSSGGTSVSLVGGSGNSTLSSSGGTSVTMFGGTGNDSLSSTGGTSVTMIGGTGNSTLVSSGGSSVTMFGGTGNDSLSSSGGSSVSVIGGSGNDTLSSTGGTNVTLQGGGAGNDSISSSGGTSVTLFGGTGSDTLTASGGTGVGLYGLEGNNVYNIVGPITASLNDLGTFGQQQSLTDSPTFGTNTIAFPGLTTGITLDLSNTSPGPAPQLPTDPGQPQVVARDSNGNPIITLSLTGQFQNVVGTPGNDWIHGGLSSNLLDGDGSGNDTLIAGAGPATLVAGSGNDSLVAGSGGTVFRFAGAAANLGSVIVDPPAGSPLNVLDFSQLIGSVSLDLRSGASQTISGSGLSLILQSPGEINAVMGGTGNTTIHGNASGDTFFVGTGNTTVTGGGGADAFFFSGSPTASDSIIETSTGNMLNFNGLAAPIALSLQQARAGAVQTVATGLTLTLSDPSAYSTIVGTPYADVITGNETTNQRIIGGNSNDSLSAGNGNDLLQGHITQVVYLDFSSTPSGDHLYTPAEQAAILQGLQQDYADFDYFFTLDPAAAQQEAVATGGQYVTLQFNAGNAGGASDALDPGNLDLGGTTVVNVNPFLGTSTGLVPPTSANIVGLTTTIAAHELGHQSGLQHQDAFGPIGSGIFSGVNPAEFFPTFTGPSNATETPRDIMASPASVGTTLLDAAGVNGPTYLGARDAIKLAFNDSGTVQAQQTLPTQSVSVPVVLPAAAGGGGFTISQAFVVGSNGNLPALAVPNTLAPGTQDYGKTFDVTALAVNGALAQRSSQNFYAFNGQAGQLMTFQVISNNDTLNPQHVIPELLLVGPSGQVLGYNVHEFESADSTLLDVILPQNGTYFVGVDSLFGLTAGNYQLFMYSFATGTGPTSGGGDTLVGGGGNDTILGSSANDVISFAPGSLGNATVIAGSGQDIVTVIASSVNVTSTGNVTVLNQQATPTVAVTGGGTFNGAPIPAVATVTGVSGSAASSLEGVSPTLTYYAGSTASGTPLSGAPTSAGTYTVTASFAGSTNYTTATASSSFTIARVTPIVAVTDGGTYNGSAHPATALLSGVSGTAGSSLDGVSPTFTYYTGTSATGTPLSGAPISAGTYTVVAAFPGSTNYTSQSASRTFTIAQAVPSVTWATPSAITFGTALSATQLDATASVSGTFTYTPAFDAVLGVGTHTLSVLFTPTDTTNYPTATQTVQLVVNPATPIITWATPSAITCGTALSATQLDASANVAGTFTYTPAAGTVLAVGTQTLSVTFTPTDTADYTTTTQTVQLVVHQATPTVTWATPADITYGTALSATQLNASADVSGTFVYSPALGTVQTAGIQTLSVTFIPNDPIDYNTVTKTVQLVVGKATPVVIWNTPDAITYGTPLSSSQLDAHASVLGSFVYSPAAGTILGTGTQTLSVTFTPSDPANYTTATQTTQLLVNSANPISGTSVFVLSPSAAGALSLSGNAQLNLTTGPVYVNSSSPSAISLSGSAQVTAGSISTVGGTQKSGSAKFSTSPVTGVGTFGDPLSNLAVPEAATYNLLVKGAVSVSGTTSRTIDPGIYSQISVSGSGKLTMSPGIYVIAGGGFSVTGNGSVTGSGVMIYNAGSNYLSPSGHTFGVVNLSGKGNISLTAPTSGPYAGILLFQSRDNANTIALSGNGITNPGGIIYAPAAALTMSGNGKFNGSLVVNTLALSANAIAQLTAADGVTAVYSPVQVRTAYGINNLALDGTGQTIAIVDAYNNPDISQAVDAFDAQFALTSDGSTLDQLYGPASSFLTVVNQRGETGSPPATDPAGAGTNNWEMETALDVEWAHAIAPGAQIVLVEADSQSLSDLMAAVRTAAGLPGVSVVSMSWGFVEGLDILAQDEATYDSYLTTPAGHTGVTFVASTGDYGAAVPLYPAMSPNVVAVGGTSLTLNADNSYGNEVGWGAYSNALGLFLGSGGGLSQFESEPAFQQGVQSTGSRTAPDVSLLADPATGAWIADPYNFGADSPWEMVGGTSLSAPAWGGLFALIDQGRVAAGKATLGTAGPTEAQTALYGLNAADFHDITSGSNGYSAGPGYDLVSGLGSPVADRLVSDLVAYSGGPPSSTPVAPITASGLVLNSEVGSVSATVAALTRAAALHVFSAQVIGVPGPASADAFGEAIPGTAPAGRVIGSSQSTSDTPAGSAFLHDISSMIVPVSAPMTGTLPPEMPAHSVADLSNHNYALTEPKALDTFMAGGWVVADDRTRDDALGAPGFGDADDYFIRMGQDNDEADTGTDAP